MRRVSMRAYEILPDRQTRMETRIHCESRDLEEFHAALLMFRSSISALYRK